MSVQQFHAALVKIGSNAIIHREDGGTKCPCVSPEGFRDPTWHLINLGSPVCNEQGYLVDAVEFVVRAVIQPAQTGYTRYGQRANDLLGEVQRDDKIGVFPCEWNGNTINFSDWSDAGEDFILYDGSRYTIVASDKLADADGTPSHHWECGLRLLTATRPQDSPSPSDLYPDVSLYPGTDLYPVGA